MYSIDEWSYETMGRICGLFIINTNPDSTPACPVDVCQNCPFDCTDKKKVKGFLSEQTN